MNIRVLAAVLAALVPQACQSAPAPVVALAVLPTDNGRWPDECSTRDGFAAFRDRLSEAVAGRDPEMLMPLLADDVLASFGDDAGKSDFRRYWNLDQPGSSALWPELGTVLALGCSAWSEDSLAMPGYITRLPDAVDAPSAIVALRDTQLRAQPNDRAKLIGKLSQGSVVEFVGGQDFESPWTELVIGKGRAWARTSDIRGLLDYRAHFARVNGEWKLKSFVAGD